MYHHMFLLTTCMSLVAAASQVPWRGIYNRGRGRQRPPIDGTWSSWQSWSSCYKNVINNNVRSPRHPFFAQWDGFNIQSRNRTCTDPKPLFGGRQCEPPSHRFRQCSCMSPLLGTSRVNDSLLSASSNIDGYPATEVRMINTSSLGWCAHKTESIFLETYIEIDFQNFTNVVAISTIDNAKGRVTRFQLKYSLDGKVWKFVQNDKSKYVFTGNYLHNKRVRNNFSTRLVMRYLRLHVTERFDFPCLKMEVYGCVFTCGSRLTAPFGEVVAQSSQNYDQDCLWKVEVLNTTSLTFVFNIFYVMCEDGYIDFYNSDFPFSNAPLLKRVCLHEESTGIDSLTLNRNSVWIRFVSNSSSNEVSFNIRYFSKCSQVTHLIRGEPVHIKSPNFPHNYFNNLNCSWIIIPPLSSKKIEITSSKFNVEGGMSSGKCDADVVNIDTEEEGGVSKKFASYCNNNKPPEKIVITAEKVIISFISDSFTSDKGFNFSVISGLKDILPTASTNEDKVLTTDKTEQSDERNINNINAGSKRSSNSNSTGTRKIKPEKDETWTVIVICTFSSLVIVLIGTVLYLNCKRVIDNRNELNAQCAKAAAAEENRKRKSKNKKRTLNERNVLITPTSIPSRDIYTGSPEHKVLLTANKPDISGSNDEMIQTNGKAPYNVLSDVDNEMEPSQDQVDGESNYETSIPSTPESMVINCELSNEKAEETVL